VSYDDPEYVVENPSLHAGLSGDTLARAFTQPLSYNWIPLTSLSLQLDHALFGFEPAGYHLVNLALHLASSLLLFAILLRTTGDPWPSAFVAAVFALHPLHVESVAWVSERKDVLSGLFWMLSMGAWVAWCERPSTTRYTALLAALGLGLLAKPSLVTLPAALLLLDFWPLGRLHRDSFGRCVLEKLPLATLAGCFAALTLHVQRATGAVASLSAFPFGPRLANALDSYLQYLAASLWPARLAVFYPHPLGSLPASRVALATVLLAALTAAALASARARPYVLVGWLWFLGNLVPVIGLVQVGMHARADRYMYLPLIGLALACAFAGRDLARRGRGAGLAVSAAGLCAVAGMALASHRQVATWRDSVSLYEHALAVVPGNFLAHYGLAGVLAGVGREAEVEPHLRAAIASQPGWPRSHLSLGDLLLHQGRPAEALESYERARRLGAGGPELAARLVELRTRLEAASP
jgi:tetratricopeptide (TPR) repeat protein